MTTDQQLLNEVQYSVIEEPNSGAYFSTEIWTIDEVAGYMNDRIKRFVSETRISLVHETLPSVVDQGLYDLNDLDDDLIDLHRVAWLDTSSVSYELQRRDKFSFDHMLATWGTTSGIPKGYSIVTEPQMTIQLVPAPADVGTLDFLYTAVTTVVSNTGVTIPVPADFCPAIKWGVLADMLKKDGPAHDMARSDYCEMRFTEGIELAKILLRGF